MRCVTVLLMLTLCFAASPAFALEVSIANATPYEILGLYLEGVSDEGPEFSSFSALRARPGERCAEKNGNMATLTALQVDFGRGRIAVKDCALKDRAELTLCLDDAGKPILSTSDGKALPLAFSDLRFPEEDDKALDFMELVKARSREDVLKLGGLLSWISKNLAMWSCPCNLGKQSGQVPSAFFRKAAWHASA